MFYITIPLLVVCVLIILVFMHLLNKCKNNFWYFSIYYILQGVIAYGLLLIAHYSNLFEYIRSTISIWLLIAFISVFFYLCVHFSKRSEVNNIILKIISSIGTLVSVIGGIIGYTDISPFLHTIVLNIINGAFDLNIFDMSVFIDKVILIIMLIFIINMTLSIVSSKIKQCFMYLKSYCKKHNDNYDKLLVNIIVASIFIILIILLLLAS